MHDISDCLRGSNLLIGREPLINQPRQGHALHPVDDEVGELPFASIVA